MPDHKKSFQKRKIKRQLRRLYLLAVMVPVLVIGLYSVAFSRYQLQNDYMSLTRADAARLKSTLFDITTSIYTLTENIIQSYSYMRLLSSKDPASEAAAHAQLTDYMEDCRKHNASLSSVCLYTNNPSVPENQFISFLEDFSGMPWHSPEVEEWLQLWITLPETDSFGNVTSYLTLVRKMVLPSPDFQAYLVIRVSPNYVKSRLKNNEFQILCSVNASPVFYSSDSTFSQKAIPFPEAESAGEPHYSYSGLTDASGEKSLTSISTFQPYRTEDTFYICVSDPRALGRLRQMTASNLLILLIAILFPTAIILVFSSHLSSRIAVLRDAMHRASEGDYDILETFSGDDELAETFHDLRETVDGIQATQRQYYEAELAREILANEQQQMKFKILASQINPHFLYNTLETIRMQALAAGARDVAASVKLLGDSMHYVLENTGSSITTLERELHYTRSYLRIQQLRFGDRLRYDLEVDPLLNPEKVHILPLLIQPLAENAVVHGIAPTARGGHVLVQISRIPRTRRQAGADEGRGLDAPPGKAGTQATDGRRSPDSPPGGDGMQATEGRRGPDSPPGGDGMQAAESRQGPDSPPDEDGMQATDSGRGLDAPPRDADTLAADEERLLIRVRDDGQGMTPESLEQLLRQVHANTVNRHAKSIGLANIHHRLCLLYGDAYTFHIDSSPCEGTDITLSFPLEQTEMRNFL